MKHLPFSTGIKSCYYNNMAPISRFLKEKFMALHVLIFFSSSNIQPCVNLFFFNYFLFCFHLAPFELRPSPTFGLFCFGVESTNLFLLLSSTTCVCMATPCCKLKFGRFEILRDILWSCC